MPTAPRPQLAEDLRSLIEELHHSDRANMVLIGAGRPRNPVRDELLRLVAMIFFQGHIETFTFYEDACLRLGSPSRTRNELRFLSARGLLFLVPSERDKRSIMVIPSERLINGFDRGIPAAKARIRARIEDKYPETGRNPPKN